MAEGDVDHYVQDTFFKSTAHGVVVEVGAAHPDLLSVSKIYRDRGWRIVAVEPNPLFCAEHRKRGYEVLEYAASDTDGENVDFFVVDSSGSTYEGVDLSFESFSSLGLNEDFQRHWGDSDPSRMRKISVAVRRLDTILATHAPDVDKIDLLTIDVEGWELQVLKGLDFARFQPRVVILENVFQDLAYENAMIALGYERCKWIYPNEVYIHRTPALLAARIVRRILRPPFLFLKSVLPPNVRRALKFWAK